MAESKKWQLWELSPVVYTLEDAESEVDHKNNLIARSIPAKKREERKLAKQALERLSMQGVESWLQKQRIKQYRAAGYPLYELVIGRSTVWRMFLVKQDGNVYVIIIDVFESHKGNNGPTTDRAKRSKGKFDEAVRLAEQKFGGA